jgi:hypothetical protein
VRKRRTLCSNLWFKKGAECSGLGPFYPCSECGQLGEGKTLPRGPRRLYEEYPLTILYLGRPS